MIPATLNDLTQDELQLARMVTRGLTGAEIARRLGISQCAARRRLSDLYHARAIRYAQAVTGDGTNGEDALHDVLVRLMTRPIAHDNVGGLLWIAVRNRVLDIQRYHGRRQYVTIRPEWAGTAAVRGDRRPIPSAFIDRDTPEDAAIARETQGEVRATLACLTPICRDALVARYWHETPVRETDNTFKTRLRRGRQAFRRQWEGRAA